MYVRPYSKGQKDNFRDAEATAEAVQRPTMKFVATKTAEQLHRLRTADERPDRPQSGPAMPSPRRLHTSLNRF
jgi:transposase